MRTGASSGPSKRYWRAGVFVSLTAPTLTVFSYVSDPGPLLPTPGSRTSPPHSHTAFTGCRTAGSERRPLGLWVLGRGGNGAAAGRGVAGAGRRCTGRAGVVAGPWALPIPRSCRPVDLSMETGWRCQGEGVRGIGRAGPRSGAVRQSRRDRSGRGQFRVRPGGAVPTDAVGPQCPDPSRRPRRRKFRCRRRGGRTPFPMRPDGAVRARADRPTGPRVHGSRAGTVTLAQGTAVGWDGPGSGRQSARRGLGVGRRSGQRAVGVPRPVRAPTGSRSGVPRGHQSSRPGSDS